jgi:hypothetical protein
LISSESRRVVDPALQLIPRRNPLIRTRSDTEDGESDVLPATNNGAHGDFDFLGLYLTLR